MSGFHHRSGLVGRESIENRVRHLLATAETNDRPEILDEIDLLIHAAHVDPVVTTRTGKMPLSKAWRTFQGSSAAVFRDCFGFPSYTRSRHEAETLVRMLAGPGTANGIASDAVSEGVGEEALALRILQRFMDPGRTARKRLAA